MIFYTIFRRENRRVNFEWECIWVDDGSDDNTLYLLHMFIDIDNRKPTFSLQKDAVTADQVTTALFGIKKLVVTEAVGVAPKAT